MNQRATRCRQIARLFRQPEQLGSLGLSEWDTLIRICRRGNLLAKLAESAESANLIEGLPQSVATTLSAALTLSRRQERAVFWEIRCLGQALGATGLPLVLLKGAAYLAQGIPAARGRLYSDIDILVPMNRIGEVESELMKNGWATTHHNAYDQRYYRQWMHELPPMKHRQRGTVIDVHHRILPRTSRHNPDPARMLSSITPARLLNHVYTLSPVDMLLHSASHLFHEGELANGFRDLLDIDALFRRVTSEHGAGDEIWPRARELNLVKPLKLALHYAARIIDTPPDAQNQTGKSRHPMLDWMYMRALHPHHPLLDSPGAGAARLGLYIRAHWLRMPPLMLAQHLSRKMFARVSEAERERFDPAA